MARRVEGSVIVLTGASSGIGRAAAVELARAGARLVLAARRKDALEEVARECGGRACVVPTDVTDPEAVERLALTAVDRFGRIDTWINNAAVGIWARFEDTPLDAFRRLIEVNLFGYIHGSKAALKRFRAQGEGLLVQVASVVAKVPYPYMSAYVASKHAVLGFTSCLRQELELEGKDIHVGLVLPATIDTPFYENAAHYGGVIPRVMPPVYPPEQVARALLAMTRRPRRELFVGFAGKAMATQHKLAPRTTEVQMARLSDRMLVEHDETAVDDPSSLFEARPGNAHAASGGWQPRSPALGRAASFGLVMLGGGLLMIPGIGELLAGGLLGLAAGIGTSRRSLHEPTPEEVVETVEARDLAASVT